MRAEIPSVFIEFQRAVADRAIDVYRSVPDIVLPSFHSRQAIPSVAGAKPGW
jgi:hypothetical protein